MNTTGPGFREMETEKLSFQAKAYFGVGAESAVVQIKYAFQSLG